MTGFPTSADIYLEMDGKKVAVVQSYTAKASKTSQSVEAFGESEPVATIEGQKRYTLELTRLYATTFTTWPTFPWSSASRTGESSTVAASGAASRRMDSSTLWWRKRSLWWRLSESKPPYENHG